MGQRAINKKMNRKIKVGDLVTWGDKVEACPVLEVCADGVFVNGGERFPRLFVIWVEIEKVR